MSNASRGPIATTLPTTKHYAPWPTASSASCTAAYATDCPTTKPLPGQRLTTLHTSDAPSVVVRLIEMDVAPFLVGSSVDCVLARRPVRRLCDWAHPDR
jgi:hypothetical protein